MIPSRLLLASVAAASAVAVGASRHQDEYDPLAVARASIGKVRNREATVPPQCYTETEGTSNPCWTCHVVSQPPNHMDDWTLQEEYAFSDVASKNHWSNLFRDRTAELAEIGDAEVLEYVRQDNYAPLVDALRDAEDYPGYVPDLDFGQGFDAEGFARDGSGWRALRYKPFNGTFWPTNGSTDDVMIRLPEAFRRDASGTPSREIYELNLAILEAAIAAPPGEIDREVEPVDEETAGVDLNGDGVVSGRVDRIRVLPEHYVGGARDVATRRYLFPELTEFLHTVRYVDPDTPTMMSTRMKEVRYSRKVRYLDDWARIRVFEEEHEHKERGWLPVYAGTPLVGLVNDFGWQLQGFIEDEKGRLRLQTEEEHLACLGCHGALGVTVDQTFTLARKVPGSRGWGHQSVEGIADVPQAGHDEPEILTWFERVGGGDEFRSNREILERFFPGGELDEAEVRRAAPGGDRDIRHLILPSRQRALDLDRAYMVTVREQAFHLGRDAFVGPVENVHREIQNGSTGLAEAGKVFLDGSLWLQW